METLTSKEYFDKVSQDWDQMGGQFFGEAPRKRIYSILDDRPGMSVADIGTGSGYLLEGLMTSDHMLFAIDQSQAMLDQLSQKFAKSGRMLLALQGTSESLPLETASTDAVIANMYLHHVEHPSRAIAEMVRILKPGGQLIFTDLDKHDYHQLVEEQYDRWMGFDRSDIMTWMSSAGLIDVSIDCVGADCCTTTACHSEVSISIFVAHGRKPYSSI